MQTAGNAGDNVSFSSAINGAQSLGVNAGTAGNVSFGGTIGQTTALTSLAVTAASASLPATRTGALSVTTSGGNIGQTGGVVATGATTLDAAGGTVTLNNAANNFGGAVSTTAAAATLRDTNAIVLGASSVAGNFDVFANGAVTQTGAVTVGGTAAFAAGAANNVTLMNATNDFGAVAVSSGNVVNIVDANALTVGASSVGTLTAQTLSGNLTLGGNLTATGSGNAIVLSAADNFQNGGGFALAPGTGRWLVYSSNPAPATNLGGLVPAFKRYNCTLVAGCLTLGTTIPGAGNGVLYRVAPTLDVGANGVSIEYGTAPSPLTYTASGFIDGDTAASALVGALARIPGATSGSGNEVAGTTAITQGTVASPLGYQIAYTGASYAITPKALLAGLTGAVSKEYDATPTATLAPGNYTLAGVIAGDTVALNNPAAGTYDNANAGVGKTVSVAGLSLLGADAGNYAVSPLASAAIGTITPATLTYAAAIATRAYGDPNPTFSGAVTGFVGGETIATATTGTLAFTSPALATSNVGSYGIDGSGLAANNGNYVFVQDPANATALTIAQRPITLTAGSASREYGDPNPPVGVSANPTGPGTGLASFDTLASAFPTLGASSGATLTTNVGTYANGANAYGVTGATNANYAVTTTQGALDIVPAPLTYVADSASRPYGEPNPALAGAVSGFKNGETIASATSGTLAFGTAASQGSPVGGYAIAGSGLAANNGNYAFGQAPGNATALTVTPRPISIAADAGQGKVYGDVDPVLTYTVANGVGTTGTPLYGTDALVGVLVRDAGKNVGTYAIRQGTLAPSPVPSNYAVTFSPRDFSITPATLVGMITAAGKVYDGGNAATITGRSLAGVLGGDSVSYVGGSATFADRNAGTGKTVTAAGLALAGADASNYSVNTTATTAADIIPATLTYLANPATVVQGTAFPRFTGTVQGFVSGDTQANATTGALAFDTTAASASRAGVYPIDGGGLTANVGNYVFAQAPANATALTIEPRTAPIDPVVIPNGYTGALASAAQSESTCAELQAGGQAETLCGAQQNFRASEQVNLVPGWRRVVDLGTVSLTVEGGGVRAPEGARTP